VDELNQNGDTFLSFVISCQNVIIYDLVLQGCTVIDHQEVVSGQFLDYIQDHLFILKKLSTENLIHLFSMKNHTFAQMRPVFNFVEQEIMERLALPESILAGSSLAYYVNFKGRKENSFSLSGMSLEHIEQVSASIYSSISYLKRNYPNDYRRMQGKLNLRTVQNYCSLLEQGGFTEKKYDTIDRIALENRHTLDSIHYGIFADEVYQLGEDFICLIARYPNICKQIVELSHICPKVMKVIGDIVCAYSSSSDFFYHQILHDTLYYLYHILDFSNLENLSYVDIVNMALLEPSHLELTGLREYKQVIQDFDHRFQELLDDSHSINELRDIYCLKYFGLSQMGVWEFLRTFQLMDVNSSIIQEMNDVILESDEEKLVQKYWSCSFIFTPLDILKLKDQLRRECARSYVDALMDTEKKIDLSVSETVSYHGSSIQVIQLDDDFSLIVHSTDSQIVGASKEMDDHVVDSWNHPRDAQTRLVASSYINQDNFRLAPLGENGVYMGFIHFHEEQIEMISSYDSHSRLGEMKAVSFKDSCYIPADHMASSMRCGWSEIDHQLTNPDYIVLWDDATEKQKENAYEAALKWGIPILSLSKMKLRQRQIQKQNDLMTEFRIENDYSMIKKLVNCFESLANSFDFHNEVGMNQLPDFMVQQKLKIESFLTLYMRQISCFPEKLAQLENILKEELMKYQNTVHYNGILPKAVSCLNIDELLHQVYDMKQGSYFDFSRVDRQL